MIPCAALVDDGTPKRVAMWPVRPAFRQTRVDQGRKVSRRSMKRVKPAVSETTRIDLVPPHHFTDQFSNDPGAAIPEAARGRIGHVRKHPHYN